MAIKRFRNYSQRYISWILRIGRIKSTILGLFILSTCAIIVHYLLEFLFGNIDHFDILRSAIFGLITAPFVIYFYHLLIERLEKTRILMERSLDEAAIFKDVIEKNNRNKGKLLATLSHELRTPLNGIVGLSEILLDTEVNQKQKEYLHSIHFSAVSLGYIFNDLIDLEKFDSTGIVLVRSKVKFKHIIQNINHIAQVLAKPKNISFSVESDPNLPTFIEVDLARLNQVLWNLLNNAMKFTEESGQVHLKICRKSPDHFIFSLKDNGCGIAKEEQKNIFKLYYQIDGKQKGRGTGIGLAISRNIAYLMDGDLTVESDIGEGSTFHLTIVANEAYEQEDVKKFEFFDLNVLLVEDVEINVLVAKTMLEKLGAKVDIAYNGKETYEKVSRNVYDLILLDIQLPDTTGFEIAQKLQEKYQNDELEILPLMVALSANVRLSNKDYINKGMDDVLHKPLKFEDLTQCLKKYFVPQLRKQPKLQSYIDELCLEKLSNHFDIKLLKDLLKALDCHVVLEQLNLCEDIFESYHQELDALIKSDRSNKFDNIKAQAHKMKGALLAVALRYFANICQEIEDLSKEQKEENLAIIAQKAQELTAYKKDIQELKNQLLQVNTDDI